MVDEGNEKNIVTVTSLQTDHSQGVMKSGLNKSDRQKTRQGRPFGKDGPNGRELLLERTREALRVKPRADLQRQEIAEIAGVTPALVSYYFPDKWDLIEESAAALIDDYFQQIRVITDESDPSIEGIQQLVNLYVKFSLDNGYTLDFFLQNIKSWKNANRYERTTKAYDSLKEFFRTLSRQKIIGNFDPAVLNSVLWSSCHYLAQQYISRPSSFIDGESFGVESIAEEVLRLFMYGLVSPDRLPSSQPVIHG